MPIRVRGFLRAAGTTTTTGMHKNSTLFNWPRGVAVSTLDSERHKAHSTQGTQLTQHTAHAAQHAARSARRTVRSTQNAAQSAQLRCSKTEEEGGRETPIADRRQNHESPFCKIKHKYHHLAALVNLPG